MCVFFSFHVCIDDQLLSKRLHNVTTTNFSFPIWIFKAFLSSLLAFIQFLHNKYLFLSLNTCNKKYFRIILFNFHKAIFTSSKATRDWKRKLQQENIANKYRESFVRKCWVLVRKLTTRVLWSQVLQSKTFNRLFYSMLMFACLLVETRD